MRIVTWNVNGINGRLALLLDWLEHARPDVVCLQELKAPQEKFPEKAIATAGYGAISNAPISGTVSTQVRLKASEFKRRPSSVSSGAGKSRCQG